MREIDTKIQKYWENWNNKKYRKSETFYEKCSNTPREKNEVLRETASYMEKWMFKCSKKAFERGLSWVNSYK